MNFENLEVLYTPSQIAARTAELGERISGDYRGEPLTLVVLMNGGMIFAADLMRQLTIPVRLDSVSVSSYCGHNSTGELDFRSRLKLDVTRSHVLLVDEVFDTGTTLARLRRFMADRGALSVRAAVAVVKEVKRAPEIVLPEYIGFHAPDRYLVGYGLDSSEDGRQLPFIAAV